MLTPYVHKNHEAVRTLNEYRLGSFPLLLGLVQLPPGERNIHRADPVPLKEFHPAGFLSFVEGADRGNFYRNVASSFRATLQTPPPNTYLRLQTSTDAQQHAFVGLYIPGIPLATRQLPEVTVHPISGCQLSVHCREEPALFRTPFCFAADETAIASPIHFVRDVDPYRAADTFAQRVMGQSYMQPSRVDGFMSIGGHPAENFNHVVLFGSHVPSTD